MGIGLAQTPAEGPSAKFIFISLGVFAAFLGMMLIASVVDKKGPAWYYCCLISAAIAFPISLWSLPFYVTLRREISRDVEHQMGRVGCEAADLSVGGGNDRQVGGNRAIAGIQG